MKKFRFLLIAVALVAVSSLYSCGGASDKETATDTTQVTGEPTPEEAPDSTAK